MRDLKVFIYVIPLVYFFHLREENIIAHTNDVTSVMVTKLADFLHDHDNKAPYFALNPTFYNEQQYAWGFGLQNSTADVIDTWQVRITNANYQLDPTNLTNQSAFDYVEINNGDGTFDLVLTGNSSISGWGGIPGGNIAWNGGNFGFNPTSDGITVYTGTDVVIPGGAATSLGVVITNRRITYRVNN